MRFVKKRHRTEYGSGRPAKSTPVGLDRVNLKVVLARFPSQTLRYDLSKEDVFPV